MIARPVELLALVDHRGLLRPMAAIELDVVKHAIKICGGNVAEAARRLGVGRSTVYRWLAAAAKVNVPTEST